MDLNKLPTRARASRDCRVVGSRSAPLRGSATTGAWPRTTREVVRHRRSLNPCGNDAAHAQEAGRCLRIFR